MTANEALENFNNRIIQVRKDYMADLNTILTDIGMDRDVVRIHDGSVGQIKVIDHSNFSIPEYRFYKYNVDKGRLSNTQSGKIPHNNADEYILKNFIKRPEKEEKDPNMKGILKKSLEQANKDKDKDSAKALKYAIKCIAKLEKIEKETKDD